MSDASIGDLNETLHAKARLGIMTILLANGESDFRSLKDRLGFTDGNLGAHLHVLEDAGYLAVKKAFVGRKPRTTARLTPSGKKAFLSYLEQLESVIQRATGSAKTRR